MTTPIDKTVLAATLVEAAANATGIQPLTNTWPDLDADTAYEIQDAVVQARVDAGRVIVGAKTGLTSAAKQKQMTALEEHYGFAFDDDEITGEAFATVGTLAALVEAKLAG